MKFRFHNFAELKEILDSEKISAPDYALQREAFITGNSVEAAAAELDRRIGVTREALIKGLQTPQISRSGLTRGAAAAFATAERALIRDGLFRRAAAYALAINEVNACGGRIVSFPTAGSSGIVPGTIWAWWDLRREREKSREAPEIQEIQGISEIQKISEIEEIQGISGIEPLPPPYDRRLREAFLVSSLVGILIAQGATLAGSEGGCQAECGSAGAMAACALSWLEGLSLDQCFSAAALSLKNSLGLACDPVAGLVEVPCVKRNAFVAVNALIAVDLTLSGVESVIPFDEVVWAMKQIGNALPVIIKENSTGGLAMTPTGLSYKESNN